LNLRGKAKYIGIGISILTLAIFALVYGPENLLKTFVSLPVYFLFFFLAALCLHILSFIFWASRISILSKASGIRVTFPRAMIVVLSSLFAASLTPGYVGGEPVRIKKLSDYGASYGTSTAVVLGERGFDAIFFVSVFIIVILTGLGIVSGKIGIYAVAGTIVLVFFIVFLFISMSAHRAAGKINSVVSWIFTRIRKGGRWLQRDAPDITEEVQSYSLSTRQIFLNRPGYFVAGIAVTTGMWLSDFSVPILPPAGLRCHAFSPVRDIYPGHSCPHLPGPNNTGAAGLMEVIMLATFSVFLSHSYLVAFVIMWRFITFYFNIILGSLALHKIVTK